MPRNNPHGTWKLVSALFEFSDTHELVDLYGAHPVGFIIIGEDQRMMTVIAGDDRTLPSNSTDEAYLFESMMAYSGKYRIEGDDLFIVKVYATWHPAWAGTERSRFFKVTGDNLLITTAQQTHPNFPGRTGRGVIKWTRE